MLFFWSSDIAFSRSRYSASDRSLTSTFCCWLASSVPSHSSMLREPWSLHLQVLIDILIQTAFAPRRRRGARRLEEHVHQLAAGDRHDIDPRGGSIDQRDSSNVSSTFGGSDGSAGAGRLLPLIRCTRSRTVIVSVVRGAAVPLNSGTS